MKKAILFVGVLALCMSAAAQLRVLNNGHVVAGNYSVTIPKVAPDETNALRAGSTTSNTLALDTTAVMTIASNVENGGYISFGTSGHVKIGEMEGGGLGNILNLYAKNSLRYTSPRRNHISLRPQRSDSESLLVFRACLHFQIPHDIRQSTEE